MPYHFKSGESIGHEMRRIRREELESAVSQLRAPDLAGRDKAIHEARKCIKKTRGLLRLLAPSLGRVYKPENTRLRAIGRKLSPLRDGGAMIETFQNVIGRFEADLNGQTFGTIRAGLVSRKEESERSSGIEATLKRAANQLDRLAQHEKRLTPSSDGFAAIAPGLRATLRKGRKALQQVRESGHAEDFHTFRRRVKDHWYHVRLLEPLAGEDLNAYEESLKALETALGDEHNLTLLEAKISAEPAYFGAVEDVETFVGLIERYRKELRAHALELGETIYGPKPREFSSRIEQRWNSLQTAVASA